ncbi:MAG TPA: DUF1080 domain-containing protein [Bacteroidales bacterium]|nr:DUF1080 domain-containing protein [Bacteroidales bacterium]
MYTDKRTTVKQLLLILFPVIIFLNSCTGRQKHQKDVQQPVVENADSSLIFDGKTLEGWEITNFGPQGPVYVSGGEIILGMGEGCTGITWTNEFPTTDYKVSLEAKRVSGNDFFCGMTFPVGKYSCTLVTGGWGGTVVGLSSINKMDASENETTTLMKFEKDCWYRICLEVTNDTIKALIDDVIVVDFAIGDNKLSIRPEVELSKPFGIASWTTTAAIKNIRLINCKQ